MKIDREDLGLAALFHPYLLTGRCSLLSSGNHIPYHFPLNIVLSFFFFFLLMNNNKLTISSLGIVGNKTILNEVRQPTYPRQQRNIKSSVFLSQHFLDRVNRESQAANSLFASQTRRQNKGFWWLVPIPKITTEVLGLLIAKCSKRSLGTRRLNTDKPRKKWS